MKRRHRMQAICGHVDRTGDDRRHLVQRHGRIDREFVRRLLAARRVLGSVRVRPEDGALDCGRRGAVKHWSMGKSKEQPPRRQREHTHADRNKGKVNHMPVRAYMVSRNKQGATSVARGTQTTTTREDAQSQYTNFQCGLPPPKNDARPNLRNLSPLSSMRTATECQFEPTIQHHHTHTRVYFMKGEPMGARKTALNRQKH